MVSSVSLPSPEPRLGYRAGAQWAFLRWMNVGCRKMEEARGWFFANLCCCALPSPSPESSSEQLAPLERKLRCLEQEKLELSRKLQGMGAIRARAGWVCPAAGQAPKHYGCPHTGMLFHWDSCSVFILSLKCIENLHTTV